MLILFSLTAMLVMGYHPGIEDDGVYLAAIKSDLNPALYPHDPQFFRTQSQATLFDNAVAAFVRISHLPLSLSELLLQLVSIFLILAAAKSIAGTLFKESRAQWAGVALTASMLTLPVSGTAIYLADQHLHPRNIATGLTLLAVSLILRDRFWQAIPFLLFSFTIHPIMASFGCSFCLFLKLATHEPVHAWLRGLRSAMASAVPLGWIFESPTPEWKRALATRNYMFLSSWTWYEWLGVLGPLVLFCLLWRIALKRGDTRLARFGLAVFAYGIFQQAVATMVFASPGLVRLLPLQPMRYLQLVYVFMTLLAGSFIGKALLKARILRWAVFLALPNAGMFASQRALFPNSPHIELPGIQSRNPWLQSFAWIRENTPIDAYFAIDPQYLSSAGEDFHSFRALAERSQLADAVKDPAVVTQVPELGSDWERQVNATAGWHNFKLSDFQRLKTDFKVDWALVSFPSPEGLPCVWHNQKLSVCRIPSVSHTGI